MNVKTTVRKLASYQALQFDFFAPAIYVTRVRKGQPRSAVQKLCVVSFGDEFHLFPSFSRIETMGKLTKEEEVLLSSYSPSTSGKSTLFFYANALIISVAPIYLFYGVHQMEISDSWIVWVISALASTYLLTLASKNQKHLLKHQIITKRGPAVDREINAKYANDKKMSNKEKEERALFRKNEVADAESTYLSIFYTNTLFLSVMLILAFFLLANVAPVFNLLLSIVGSAGLVAFLSTAKN
ncbi:unnamed protein product [Caenorhabditis auriculariae]|uniref:Translocon-associated protein subunit gamma n=1 Tax=Caenorhabditis auriculariae TaxID=2777116 RepID=A0A8S1H5V5_9PELO|nr:unnamed protein product [Caenorhabditis auriculariae]